jgi:hypothetical protein
VSVIERAVDVGEVWPLGAISHDQYDYYLPAMSVIPLFDIAHPCQGVALPYIVPSPTYVKKWRAVLKNVARSRTKTGPVVGSGDAPKAHGASIARTHYRVGIQWQGNMEFEHVEFKSIPATLLAPFAEHGALVSLQRLETIGENKFPADTPLFNTQTGAPSWEDTLAAISEMDYVIAGDTTIAHMAGALGKKTLLLLPHAPHPYWADLKEVSTWYPSVHVFRQPQYNDWAGAAQKAHEFLTSELSK